PVKDYFFELTDKNALAATVTDSLGNFSFELSDFVADTYQIVYGSSPVSKYELYVEKGDSLYVEQNGYWENEDTFIVSGRGAEKLAYLMKDHKIFQAFRFDSEAVMIQSKTNMGFKMYMDSIQELRLQSLHANTTTPKVLKTRFTNNILAEHANILLHNLEYRNLYLHGEFTYHYPSKSYIDFLDTIHEKDTAAHSLEYKNLANSYVQHKAKMAFKDLSITEFLKNNLQWKFDYILSQPTKKWTDYLALSTTFEFSTNLESANFFQQVQTFRDTFTFQSAENKKLFDTRVAAFTRLQNGKKAPDFTLNDAAGNPVSLSDFLGKIVYIDFWGTWCTPCIEEIPESLKLQEKYKNDPVVFLYVALEYEQKNIDNWKHFIQGKDERYGSYLHNKPFPGVHLVARKQFKNEQLKPYKLNFAPTYVLIDQKGNIVNARAERPKEISVAIDTLLKTEIAQ
ncbi:MAG: TlpA disulfide reductase family protein, partial [Bacteroidota bacterium]